MKTSRDGSAIIFFPSGAYFLKVSITGVVAVPVVFRMASLNRGQFL